MAHKNPLSARQIFQIDRVIKWLAATFLFVLLVVFIAVWTVTYTLRRDCSDVYHRNIKFPGYWLHIESGSTKSECPQHGE